jgi:hypothetical protein
MTPTTMDTSDTTHRTMLLTARCESTICGLSECIGLYFGGACLLTTLEQLHHSLATNECQHLTCIDKR